MRHPSAIALALDVALPHSPVGPAPLPVAGPNANTQPAGTLWSGVLTLALEATEAMWYPDGDTLPGRAVPAFAEVGKAPLVPGPLVRVPAGTTLRLTRPRRSVAVADCGGRRHGCGH